MEGVTAITHIFALPVQWIATALALPDSLHYWNFYLANLFFLTALCLAWWSFYTWHKSRHHFYLALYLFIIALGIIGYFATILYTYAWIYAIILSVAGLQTAWRLAQASHVPERIRRLLHHFLILGLVISIGLPVVYSLHHQVMTNRLRNSLTAQLTDEHAQLNTWIKNAKDAASTFSTDKELIPELAAGQTNQLTIELQSRMLEKGLQFIVMTNSLGTVIARAQQPTAISDNLFEELPWLAPAYGKESVNGIAFNEHNLPVVAAAEPVLQDGQVVGVVVAGYNLNNQYAIQESGISHHSLVLGTDQGIVGVSSLTARDEQLLGSASFADAVHASTLGNQALNRSFSLNSGTYIARSVLVSTLGSDRKLALVGIAEDKSSNWLIAVDALIVLVGGILLVTSLVSGRLLFQKLRRPREKKS